MINTIKKSVLFIVMLIVYYLFWFLYQWLFFTCLLFFPWITDANNPYVPNFSDSAHGGLMTVLAFSVAFGWLILLPFINYWAVNIARFYRLSVRKIMIYSLLFNAVIIIGFGVLSLSFAAFGLCLFSILPPILIYNFWLSKTKIFAKSTFDDLTVISQ